jgi:hypothetical protein
MGARQMSNFRTDLARSLLRIGRPLATEKKETDDCGNVPGCGACEECEKEGDEDEKEGL